MDLMDLPGLLINAGMASVAVAGVLVGRRGLSHSERSAGEAKRSADASEKSAQIADKALDVAKTTAHQGVLYSKQIEVYGALRATADGMRENLLNMVTRKDLHVTDWWGQFDHLDGRLHDFLEIFWREQLALGARVLKACAEVNNAVGEFISRYNGQPRGEMPDFDQELGRRIIDLIDKWFSLLREVVGVDVLDPRTQEYLRGIAGKRNEQQR